MFDPFGAAPAVTNNDNYGPVILGVTWPLTLTALILLGLRFYSNIFITRRVKADLYIATVTHVSQPKNDLSLSSANPTKFIAVIGQLCISTAVAYGIGKHIGILPHENIDHSLKWVWIGQILFVACMALGKVAIIAFLLQIRGPHDPRLGPVLLWAIAISNLILNGMTIIFILLQCDPVAKLWDRDLPGSCPGLARNQTFAFFSGSTWYHLLSYSCIEGLTELLI